MQAPAVEPIPQTGGWQQHDDRGIRNPQGVRVLVERTATAVADADRRVAELQDSMLPIESGDAELRAGLSEVRELLEQVSGAARQFLRTLGR